ncbi:hypothetical protein [Candidatus Halobonum tyrrellensis]|uniref:Uncharacterized protein n=1 Tax=Candidatus Halobonum tyrrellensis G22 TaxID=1324957 RepID=V4GS45_9EURY|nr:hypothetical protein [Candidatus Halobonum tyrrellensis]ESP87891.1 hypothetical protein K933_11261 [Candidatus Halobonum tyrrellensis G22]
MVDSRLLVRLDALLGVFALAVVVAAFYLATLNPFVGALALGAVGVGLYALLSYVRGFLVGAADPPE